MWTLIVELGSLEPRKDWVRKPEVSQQVRWTKGILLRICVDNLVLHEYETKGPIDLTVELGVEKEKHCGVVNFALLITYKAQHFWSQLRTCNNHSGTISGWISTSFFPSCMPHHPRPSKLSPWGRFEVTIEYQDLPVVFSVAQEAGVGLWALNAHSSLELLETHGKCKQGHQYPFQNIEKREFSRPRKGHRW